MNVKCLMGNCHQCGERKCPVKESFRRIKDEDIIEQCCKDEE